MLGLRPTGSPPLIFAPLALPTHRMQVTKFTHHSSLSSSLSSNASFKPVCSQSL